MEVWLVYRRWLREGVEYEINGVSDGCFIEGLQCEARLYSKSHMKRLKDFIEELFNQNVVFYYFFLF